MNIYIMKNFTTREVYFGLTEDDCRSAVSGHKGNPDSPVGHWKFDEEKIQWGEIQTDLAEGVALSFIQALRQEPQDDGWVVVVGLEE